MDRMYVQDVKMHAEAGEEAGQGTEKKLLLLVGAERSILLLPLWL